ncbi:hypothetical protein ACFLU6_00825 [Acidobacteriota bacterium]
MQPDHPQQIIRKVPYTPWFFGVLCIVAGIGLLVLGKEWLFALIAIGLGVLIILVISVTLTVEIDRNSGILVIRKKALLRSTVRQVRVNKIVEVYIARERSTGSGNSYRHTYQIKVVLDDGEEIPLDDSSSGRRGKEKMAAKLRDALSLKEK